MQGPLAILALVWWILAIINIVFCVLTKKRYKKLGWRGAAKRIILSWALILLGIIVGSALSAAVNSRDPNVTLSAIWIPVYIFELIAIFYTGSAANKAKTTANGAE